MYPFKKLNKFATHFTNLISMESFVKKINILACFCSILMANCQSNSNNSRVKESVPQESEQSEPSPRGASQIINFLLSKAGNTIPTKIESDQKELQGTVFDIYSTAIATPEGNTFSPPKKSSVSARCQYQGPPSQSDRNESCFIAIKNLANSIGIIFKFDFSALGMNSISNVSVGITQ